MADVVTLRPRLALAAGDGEPPLADRLAALLGEIIDEPLVSLPGSPAGPGPQPLELRLSHFKPELAERAAALLEEAGW